MSTLISENEGEPRVLEWFCNTFIGRRMIGGLSCDWGRPEDAQVSAVHAALTWDRRAQHWVVRDLGSSNGTHVGDRLLAPHEGHALKAGTVLAFGQARWRVDEVSPPPAAASSSRGERHLALDDVLLLPDPITPEWVLYRNDDAWWLHRWQGTVPEDSTGGERVQHGRQVIAGGRTWTLAVPVDGPIRTDMGTATTTRRLTNHRLVLEVSADFETISPRFERGDAHLPLAPRRHHELWWLLAQARRDDLAAGCPPEKVGWIENEKLVTDLGLQSGGGLGTLNVWVCRSRKNLKKAGFDDAFQFFERNSAGRPAMRLGQMAVEIIEGGGPSAG